MSPVANRLYRTLSMLAIYAGAAAGLVVVTAPARAEEIGAAWPIHTAQAPVATAEQARRRVADVLPKVEVARVEMDTAREDPHFHVDLRLAEGRTGRLNVDARTGDLSWRKPAVLED